MLTIRRTTYIWNRQPLLLSALLLTVLLIGVLPAGAQSTQPNIIFQNSSTGKLVDWMLSGTRLVDYAFLADPGSTAWSVVGSGDFTGDGNPDLLLQNAQAGDLLYWQMNGITFTQFGYIYPTNPGSVSWRVVAVADLNGDKKPDLVFQNQATGQLVYWLMNGVNRIAWGYLADPGRTPSTA